MQTQEFLLRKLIRSGATWLYCNRNSCAANHAARHQHAGLSSRSRSSVVSSLLPEAELDSTACALASATPRSRNAARAAAFVHHTRTDRLKRPEHVATFTRWSPCKAGRSQQPSNADSSKESGTQRAAAARASSQRGARSSPWWPGAWFVCRSKTRPTMLNLSVTANICTFRSRVRAHAAWRCIYATQ